MSSTPWISTGARSSEETRRTVVSVLVTLLALSAAALSDSLQLPPVIVDHPPPTLHYRPGRLVTLPCKAVASHQPRYEWYANGELVPPSNQQTATEGQLLVQTQAGQSATRYQCVARNEAGVAMSPLTTLVPAEFGRVSPSERWLVRDYAVMEGFSLRLPCNHSHSVPAQTPTWYTVSCTKGCRDQARVIMDHRHTVDNAGRLVLLHASREDDGRLYKCVAYNPVMRSSLGGSYSRVRVQQIPDSNSPSRSPSLIYQSQLPEQPVLGDNVVMTCMFDGLPDIRWRRLGGRSMERTTVGDFGRQLRVDNVRSEDAGMYACEASNSRGVSMAVLNITVHEVPRPTTNTSLVRVRVEEGAQSSVNCHVDGSPPMTYHWYYNARPLNESGLRWSVEGEVLLLDNLTLADTGLVTCNASNVYGAVLLSYYLLVHEAVLTTTPEADTSTPQTTKALTDKAPKVVAETMTTTTPSADDVTSESTTTTVEATSEATTKTTTIKTTTTKSDNKYAIENPSNKSGMSGGAKDEEWWTLVLKIGTPLGVLLLLGAALLFIFVHICKSTTTYAVGDRERNHGCNEDYDSDDSGYDEKDEKGARKKLKKKKRVEEVIEAECEL